MLSKYLLVGLGGAVGSMARFGLGMLAMRLFPVGIPYGTWGINLLGSFLIGVVAVMATKGMISDQTRTLLASGLCGGFTTFSTFSLESVHLIQSGRMGAAAVYIFGSVFTCVLGCYAGIRFAS